MSLCENYCVMEYGYWSVTWAPLELWNSVKKMNSTMVIFLGIIRKQACVGVFAFAAR